MYPAYDPSGNYTADPFGVSPPTSLDPNYNPNATIPGATGYTGFMNAPVSGQSGITQSGFNWPQFLGTLGTQLQGLGKLQTPQSPGLTNAMIAQLGQPQQPLVGSQTPNPSMVGGSSAAGGAPPGMSPLSQLASGPGGGMGAPGGSLVTSGPGNPVTGSAVNNAYLAALAGNPNANPAMTGRSGWWPPGYGG